MKTVIFIDGEYLHKISLALSLNMEFKAFRQSIFNYFEGGPVRIYYYACTKDSANATNNVKPLIDWLSYNGFIVRHKDISENQFHVEHRAFIGIQMTIDALSLSNKDINMVFCIRNPEFKPLLEVLSPQNYLVLLNSEVLRAPQIIRQNMDKIIDLEDLDREFPFLEERKTV